jgi:Aminopeptidase P, N-terminal domain.
MAQMKPKSLAVFNSNDLYPIGADANMPFEQHRDLFYLSGVDQEESILLLFPDAINPKHRELLFVRETNDHIAVWEGPKLSKAQATAVSGIETVYWTRQFDAVFADLMSEAETIYFNTTSTTANRWKQRPAKIALLRKPKISFLHIRWPRVFRFSTPLEESKSPKRLTL